LCMNKMLCACSTDIRAEEDCWVHVSHSVLCQYCCCTMGWCHHLQDQTQLSIPAGHEVSSGSLCAGSLFLYSLEHLM